MNEGPTVDLSQGDLTSGFLQKSKWGTEGYPCVVVWVCFEYVMGVLKTLLR